MMWWNSLEFVAATFLIFYFTWLERGTAADCIGLDHDATVKFAGFVEDLQTAFVRNNSSIKLVPCWSHFGSCEAEFGAARRPRTSPAYAVDFIAIGRDGRKVCLSDTHPAWTFLSSCAGEKGLALLTADDRVWAEYPA